MRINLDAEIKVFKANVLKKDPRATVTIHPCPPLTKLVKMGGGRIPVPFNFVADIVIVLGTGERFQYNIGHDPSGKLEIVPFVNN